MSDGSASETGAPVPERIGHLVERDAQGLRFRGIDRPWAHLFWGGLTGLVGAVAVVALVAVFITLAAIIGVPELGGLFFMLGMPVSLLSFVLGSMVGLVLAVTPRKVSISALGVRFNGLSAPRIQKPEALTVSGRPGHRMVLKSHTGRVITEFNPTAKARGWDFVSVGWVAQEAGRLLGVPVTDERPESEWLRWQTDPNFRARMNFDARQEVNKEAFAAHHGTEARPPEKLESNLDGMRAVLVDGFFSKMVLRMNRDWVRCGGRRVPLLDIQRAGVVYRKVSSDNGTRWYGDLEVLIGNRRQVLGTTQVRKNGGEAAAALNWAAQEIERQANLAQQASLTQPEREEGSADDVPEEMKELVQRRAAKQRQGQ